MIVQMKQNLSDWRSERDDLIAEAQWANSDWQAVGIQREIRSLDARIDIQLGIIHNEEVRLRKILG